MNNINPYLILTFLTFWSTTINHTNCILFLWPHTIQQLSPIENLSADLLITSAISSTFILINLHITRIIIINNWQLTNNTILYLIINTALTILTHATQPHNSNSSNIIIWISINNLSLFSLMSISLLSISILQTSTTSRNTYIIIITLIALISPPDPALSATILLLILAPFEINNILSMTLNQTQPLTHHTNTWSSKTT